MGYELRVIGEEEWLMSWSRQRKAVPLELRRLMRFNK
jgi:hypothetical protein